MKKRDCWLGKTPVNLQRYNEEEFNQYYCFVYGFYWNISMVEEYGEMKKYVKEKCSSKLVQSLDNDRKWWAYNLSLMKDMARKRGLMYLTETASRLLDTMDSLSINDLELYCNSMNIVLMGEGVQGLMVRPILMEKLCGIETTQRHFLGKIISLKEAMVTTIEKHMKETDIKKEYIEKEFAYDYENSSRYAGWSELYAEIFLSFVKPAYVKLLEEPSLADIPADEILKTSIATTLMMTAVEDCMNEDTIEDIQNILEKEI